MSFKIGRNCKIDSTAVIDVKDGFLGDNSIVNAFARIEGTRVEIGREAYIDRFATIGGGSCFDPTAYLKAGDWFHMGTHSQVNIARGVDVGHEFGCGIESKIFTHGAYTDSYNLGAPVQWAPVKIGNHVWLPNAWVNPGVEIGDHVVVAARSLVNRDLPKGSLAGGIPAKILKENFLPRAISQEEKTSLLEEICHMAWLRFCDTKKIDVNSEKLFSIKIDKIIVFDDGLESVFHMQRKEIQGIASDLSLLIKDQLRRNGIRFRYEAIEQKWTSWK